ncbi:hypothetical protein HDU86_006360, partial [Geranomyces michiganensis]
LQEYVASRWQFAYDHVPELLHEVQHEVWGGGVIIRQPPSILYLNCPFWVPTKHKCCGLNTFNDHAVPRNPKSVTSCIDSPEYGYHEPCAPAIKAQLATFTSLQGGAILLVIATQVFCLVSARAATRALPDRVVGPDHDDAERGLLTSWQDTADSDNDDDTVAQLTTVPPELTACSRPHALLEGSSRGEQAAENQQPTAQARPHVSQEEQRLESSLIDML